MSTQGLTTLEPPKETGNDFAAWESDRRICLKCGSDLPEGFVAACGIKNPCPNCGHMYPLGDCSD